MSAGLQIVRQLGRASSRAEILGSLDGTIDRARDSLIALQYPQGYWNAPLEAPAQMNAEFIIFNHFMGVRDVGLERRLANYLIDTQQDDGSWNLFPGGDGYASYTIEAYAALKLVGYDPNCDPLKRGRAWIMEHGGIERAGTLARFYLASIGMIPWQATAASPAELMLLPKWFPLNIYELGSWARGTFAALALLQAHKPIRPAACTIDELYPQPRGETRFVQPEGSGRLSLRSILNLVDRGLRFYDQHPLHPLRSRAAHAAERWLLDHQEANGSFGGIEPCYLLSTMALSATGYGNDHRVIVAALNGARELVWDMGDAALYMPCVSPNWNTALACRALLASGTDHDHPALRGASQWLVDHQIFRRGDWSVKRPELQPGGWAFEFFNDAYPDVDDSAVIVGVLNEIEHDDHAAKERAIAAGANWVMGMQSNDGGFAAFDVDTDHPWMNQLPLADVEAVTDPSCPDLTGRVLEMMGELGYRADHPVARRAINWLRENQSPEGSWWGRWGVNHIYGTFSALVGLRAIGVDMREPWVQRAAAWLRSKQNDDGGWGESCLSDKDPRWRGRGASTASQTAWALLGLIAAENEPGDAVHRGVRYLVERQNSAGSWNEEAFTGGGFPNHFYMRYYLYPHYFPLMALGQYRSRLEQLGWN